MTADDIKNKQEQETAMAAFEIVLVECLADNYAVLMRDHETGHCAIIDAPDAAPIRAALARKAWTPNIILVTHKHADHVQAIPELKAAYGLEVFGPEEVDPALRDHVVRSGDRVEMGNLKADVLACPGHTLGHVAFHFPAEEILFSGDTLFAMGCGRVFEGTMADMHASLQALAALPRQTRIYCGHEYTLNNARFAASVLPDNGDIAERLATVQALRDMKENTVPSTLQLELRTNIFLMCDKDEVRTALHMADASPLEVFTRLRQMKDQF